MWYLVSPFSNFFFNLPLWRIASTKFCLSLGGHLIVLTNLYQCAQPLWMGSAVSLCLSSPFYLCLLWPTPSEEQVFATPSQTRKTLTSACPDQWTLAAPLHCVQLLSLSNKQCFPHSPPPPSAVNMPPLHQIMATWELYRIRWTDAYLRTWCHRHQGLPLLWLTLYEPHCGIPHLPTHPLHSSELWVSSRVMPVSVCPWYASFVNPIPI